MDHSLYRYSGLPTRATLGAGSMPGVHGFVVLCLEHRRALGPEGAVRDPRFVGEFGSFTPDYRSWTQREYGLRIGVFRVIEALKQASIRPVVAANAEVLERVPDLVKLFTDWGCEWVGHGLAANDLMHSRMPLDEQLRHITQSLATISAATGQQPLGWLSQDWGTTPDTYALLAQAGIEYTLDWCNDDQPYAMQAASNTAKPLVAVPLSAEWDDVQCQWLRHLTPQAHADLTLSAFDPLQREFVRHGRRTVFGLALHPWVCGMASRIGPLRQLLAALATRPGAQWTSSGQIAAAFHSPQTTANPK